MTPRRLILPALLPKVLRISFDSEIKAPTPRGSRGPLVLLLVGWAAFCLGLFTMSDLRATAATATPSASWVDSQRAPWSTESPRQFFDEKANLRGMIRQPTPVPPQPQKPISLKPLRDRNDFSVFGSGLSTSLDAAWDSSASPALPPGSDSSEFLDAQQKSAPAHSLRKQGK